VGCGNGILKAIQKYVPDVREAKVLRERGSDRSTNMACTSMLLRS